MKNKEATTTRWSKAKDIMSFFAIPALVLSVVTLWFTVLRPFTLDANFGGIFLIPKYKEEPKRIQLSLGLPVTLYNQGAQAGFIEDMAVVMERTSSKDFKVLFFPYVMYDSHQMLLSKLKNEPDLLSLRETFTGIYLPPKELYFKEILFGMENLDQRLEITPGDYKFTFFIKLKGDDFKVMSVRNERVSQETINNFASNTITVLLPYAERDAWKERVLKP